MIATIYVFFSLIRSGYGVDEPTYLLTYKEYLQSGELYFEFAFNFLYSLFSFLGVEPEYFNKIIGLLFVLFICWIVSTFIRPPLRSLALLFFLFSPVTLDFVYNGYRQGFALLFVLTAVLFFDSRRYARGFLCLIAAVGFHWSAIIAASILLLQRFMSRRKIKTLSFILLFFSLIAIVTPLGILGLFSDLLEPFRQVFPDSLVVKKAILYINANDIEKSFYGLNFFGRLPLSVSIVSFLFVLILYENCFSDVIYKYSVLVMSYALLLLEMSYSFRNYYWVLPLLPLLMICVLERRCDNVAFTVPLIVILNVLVVVTGYYTSDIIYMLYK